MQQNSESGIILLLCMVDLVIRRGLLERQLKSSSRVSRWGGERTDKMDLEYQK
jgi:hypothetical protein